MSVLYYAILAIYVVYSIFYTIIGSLSSWRCWRQQRGAKIAAEGLRRWLSALRGAAGLPVA